MTLLNHLGNPKYGMDTAPPRDWRFSAICAMEPDLWHTADASINWAHVGEARHICLTHCPVREECARDVGPMRSAIVGGVFYNQQGEAAGYQPCAGRCRICVAGTWAHRGGRPW